MSSDRIWDRLKLAGDHPGALLILDKEAGQRRPEKALPRERSVPVTCTHSMA